MQQQVEPALVLRGEGSTVGTAFLKKRIDELVDLCIIEQEAADNLSTTVKDVAKKSGLLPAVVMRLVKAKACDKFREKKAEVEQLALIFEECG